MQKQKRQKVKRQKEHRQLVQTSSKLFNSHHDPLWHQTPEMGVEALIATIDSKRDLQKALKGIMERKNLVDKNASNELN